MSNSELRSGGHGGGYLPRLVNQPPEKWIPKVMDIKAQEQNQGIPQALLDAYQELGKKFLTEARVVDPTTGYIDVKFMNRPPYIDQKMLETQAAILAFYFHDVYPTRIIGIPESGLPLAFEISKLFPTAKFVKSRKENGASGSPWPNEETFSVFSFTKQQNLVMHTEHIEPGERYLIGDDVTAHGNAASEYIEALLKRKAIVVGLATGWDKGFQGGVQRISNEFGIRVVSTISVTSMLPDNRVTLAY